jgi:hypothetical protein
MNRKLLGGIALALVAFATVAAAQTYSGPKITIKPVASGAAITAVNPDATCGQPLKIGVTIKAGLVPAQGNIVVGGTGGVTVPYNVASSTTATVWVQTTMPVTCTGTNASIPTSNLWLEPSAGGSDAMMWIFKPQKVTYGASKQPFPG